jgi:hypothetical protein
MRDNGGAGDPWCVAIRTVPGRAAPALLLSARCGPAHDLSAGCNAGGLSLHRISSRVIGRGPRTTPGRRCEMDESRFDNLARSVASPSRRTLLRRLAGVALAGPIFPALGVPRRMIQPRSARRSLATPGRSASRRPRSTALPTLSPPIRAPTARAAIQSRNRAPRVEPAPRAAPAVPTATANRTSAVAASAVTVPAPPTTPAQSVSPRPGAAS